MERDYIVIVDPIDERIKPVTFEVLAAARSLADRTGRRVTAVHPGAVDGAFPKSLIQHGADRVVLLDSESLSPYSAAAWLAVLEPFIAGEAAEAVLLSATVQGKELAAALAARLNVGLASDCIAFDVAEDLLLRRPVNAGKAIATWGFDDRRPRILTLRPNMFRGPGPGSAREGEVEVREVAVAGQPLALRVKDIVRETGALLDISEARVVVSGGLGMQGPEHFHLLESLASVLGGAVGASRPVVDNGWRPYSHQVGQTGRTISPDLYIACGISGAVQHLAGMSSAKCIVAINTDPHAAIFSVADYGLVADVLEALPLLTTEFKRALGGQT